MFLIDTNIIAAVWKQNEGVLKKFENYEDEIYFCDTVLRECYFGAYKRGNDILINFYDKISKDYKITVFTPAEARLFGQVKNDLAKKGKIIEDADLQIATTALANDLTLVTDNTKHFERIEGLKVENWLD